MSTYKEAGKMIINCSNCNKQVEGKILIATRSKGISVPHLIVAFFTCGISLIFTGIKIKEQYKMFKCPKCRVVTNI